MRELKGTYAELQVAELQNEARGEYIRVILTDRRPEPEIYEFFRSLFESRDSLLMELISEYRQFGTMASRPIAGVEEKAVEELFMDFYRERRGGVEPDESEQSLLCFAGEQVRHMDGNQNRETERQITELLKFAREQGNEV